MNIAIIGMGNVGSGLVHVLGQTDHNLFVVDRNDKKIADQQQQGNGVGVQVVDLATAVKNADLVILSTPYNASVEVVKAADFNGKIVIDVSNPVTADFSALQVGHSSSAAEEIAKLIPEATVVKAFNTIFAQHYSSGLNISGRKLQTFVAADNEDARNRVEKLAEEIGFEVRDAGPLSNARYLEPLGYMNIQFGYVLGQGVKIAPQWLAA